MKKTFFMSLWCSRCRHYTRHRIEETTPLQEYTCLGCDKKRLDHKYGRNNVEKTFWDKYVRTKNNGHK